MRVRVMEYGLALQDNKVFLVAISVCHIPRVLRGAVRGSALTQRNRPI